MMKKILYIILAASLLLGSCGHPWDDYVAPDPLPGDTLAVKVMSWGIGNAKGSTIFTEIADQIIKSAPDIVILREVDKNTTRSKGLNQAAEIATLTGMNYFFVKGIDYQGGEYGAAILSKFPLKFSISQPLPVDAVLGGEVRPMALVKIEPKPGREVVIVGASMDDGANDRGKANRTLQATTLLNLIATESADCIVAGNFYFRTNADPAPLVLRQQLKAGCNNCEMTAPAIGATDVVDHIMYRTKDRMKVKSYVVLGNTLTNRLPVVAELLFIK